MAETADKSYTAFFVQGVSADGVDENDLVFYKFLSKHNDSDGTDRQLSDYLSGSQTLSFTFRETSDLPDESDLNKLYLISEATNVNFPLLNAVQRKIVETENANVLVQGVAGSGKTNVCVEKIVYCACRGYRGKILYTTFSRGLLTETKTRSNAFLRSIKDFLVSYENGEFTSRALERISEANMEKLKANPENLYWMHHSVAHRRIADPNTEAPYALRHFAYDQKFGATLRYDFDADEGKKITMCRFSPDGSKLFIALGEIVCGGGYENNNCTQKVIFRVNDQMDTFRKQSYAGNHCSLVYGDYAQKLADLAETLGIEAVVAK